MINHEDRKRNKYQNKTGFTLIELLTVISIIGLLSSGILVSVRVARSKARDTARVTDVVQFVKAATIYQGDYGSYPAMAADDTGTCLDLSTIGGFVPGIVAAGYMPKNIKDPGGVSNNYWYVKGGTVTCDQTLMFDCVTPGAQAELVVWFENRPVVPPFQPNDYGARSESVCLY